MTWMGVESVCVLMLLNSKRGELRSLPGCDLPSRSRMLTGVRFLFTRRNELAGVPMPPRDPSFQPT